MSITLIPVFFWGLDLVDFVLQVLAWGFAIFVLLPLALFIVFVPLAMLVEWPIAVYDRWKESREKGEIR